MSLILLAFVAWLCLPSRAAADSPSPLGGVAPRPIGETRVQMASFNIIINTLSEEQGTSAEVLAIFRLYNPDRREAQGITMAFREHTEEVTFQPQAFTEFELLAGNQPAQLTPIEPVGYTTALTVAAESQLELRMRYIQPFGQAQIPSIRFDPRPLAAWPGDVGSARVEVRTMPPGRPQTTAQVLAYQPEDMAFEGGAWVWQASRFQPTRLLEMSFIAHAAWERLEALQARTAEQPSDVSAWLELGRLYRSLAEESAEHSPLFMRRAFAAYTQAQALAPTLAEPAEALAEIYRSLAAGAGAPSSDAYLALAAEQEERLLGLRPADAELHTRLKEAYALLAKQWKDEGDYAAAAKALEKLSDLSDVEGERQEIAALREELAGAWAVARLADGDLAGALAALSALYGDDFVAAEVAPLPLWRGVEGQMTLTDQALTAVIALFPYPMATAQHALLLDEVAKGLEGARVAKASAAEGSYYTLEVAIACERPETCVTKAAELAALVPQTPAWDALRGMLLLEDFRFTFQQQPFKEQASVSLKSGVGQSILAAQAQAAAAKRDTPTGPDDAFEPLRAALAPHIERAWLELADQQHLRLNLALDVPQAPSLAAGWVIHEPLSEPLTAGYTYYRPLPIFLAMLGMASLLSLALWLLLRRSRPSGRGGQ